MRGGSRISYGEGRPYYNFFQFSEKFCDIKKIGSVQGREAYRRPPQLVLAMNHGIGELLIAKVVLQYLGTFKVGCADSIPNLVYKSHKKYHSTLDPAYNEQNDAQEPVRCMSKCAHCCLSEVFLFEIKKITRYGWMLVVTELVVRTTKCIIEETYLPLQTPFTTRRNK